MTADELRAFIATHDEADYLLIDVRQPAEYETGHLAGAVLMPLLTMERQLYDLPKNYALVFYCHNGARSQYAASLVGESELTQKQVFHLMGGLLAWHGRTLTGLPKSDVLASAGAAPGVFKKAMALEKGARRFYEHLQGLVPAGPLSDTIARLAATESMHAQSIYKQWRETDPELDDDFETLYARLDIDRVEDGCHWVQVTNALAALPPGKEAEMLDMAFAMELAAFDLYRSVAETFADQATKQVFRSLAQAEKAHMQTLVQLIESLTSSPNTGQ